MSKTVKQLEDELESIRAALATVGGTPPAPVTEAVTDPNTPAVGTVIHVLAPVALGGDIRNRGAVLEVTQPLIDSTTDRTGKNRLVSLIERGVIGVGEWPEGLQKWTEPGDQQWTFERAQALDAVAHILNPAEREAAKKAVQRRFGPAPEGWREPPKQTRSKWSY